MVDPHVADYQQWLKRHRGVGESTAKRHGLMVMRLLAVLGRDPFIYDAGLIRRAILAEAQQCSPSHVKDDDVRVARLLTLPCCRRDLHSRA